MLIVGLMMGLSSVLGLPWCVAATVLCLGHVDSLKMETESSAPGEKPRFLGIREQRVTGTVVFLLTGLSVKLAPVLKVNIRCEAKKVHMKNMLLLKKSQFLSNHYETLSN